MKGTVLITGASSGLGYEFSKLFAREGYTLVLTARNSQRLLEIKEEVEGKYGCSVHVFAADLSREEAADGIFEFTKSHNLQIDFLVNNAGFGDFGEFAQLDPDKQCNMINVNVFSLTKLCRLFIPQMAERKNGKILNTASIAAFQAGPLMAVYYATKAYVLSLTEALSYELKNSGIAVTALCPGPTKTGFEDSAGLENSGLFKNLKVADAKSVAEYGYKSAVRGKVIAIPGLLNKLTVTGAKFAPRSLSRAAAYKIQK